MEDNSALSRRSNLPTRIAPDRPHGQTRQFTIGNNKEQGKTNEPLQEHQILRAIKKTSCGKEMKTNNTTSHLDRRNAEESNKEMHGSGKMNKKGEQNQKST